MAMIIRYVEFKDRNGTLGMIRQAPGSDKEDTETHLRHLDTHLLHHVKQFGWKNVIAYHPDYPLQKIMQRANEIADSKGNPHPFDEEAIAKADPKYKDTITIHRLGANGIFSPVYIETLPAGSSFRMQSPIIGAPLPAGDPNNPIIHAAVPAADAPVIQKVAAPAT